MDFLVDPSSEQSLRIRGLISSGLIRLVLGEVALPRFTRDCIRRPNPAGRYPGDSRGGLYESLALTDGFAWEAGATFVAVG